MNILIAYGSTEGHTRKIAHHMEKLAEKNGLQATVIDCGSLSEKPDLGTFDAFILAGSVHNGEHQSALATFVKDHLDLLNEKPAAFVSVSLSASFEDSKDEAQNYVTGFLEETNWQPQAVHLAEGAIRYLEYDFFKKFTIKYMVLKGKDMPDPSAGNPEYTDWAALEDFVVNFVATRCK